MNVYERKSNCCDLNILYCVKARVLVNPLTFFIQRLPPLTLCEQIETMYVGSIEKVSLSVEDLYLSPWVPQIDDEGELRFTVQRQPVDIFLNQ